MNPAKPGSAHSIGVDKGQSAIVVFVAGERQSVDAAVFTVSQMYHDRPLLFVCEPRHSGWFSRSPVDEVFIVEQPFNPFGRVAAILLRKLRTQSIEACAILVADLGFESFRFRVFALRLRAARYIMLRASGPKFPKPMGRILFSLRAGVTLLFRIILKIPGVNAVYNNIRAGSRLGLRKAIGQLFKTVGPDFLARLLRPLDQPFAIGLAWIARFFMVATSSRVSQSGKEILHVIPSIGMGGVQRQLVLLLKNRSPEYKHSVVVLRSEDRFFDPELSKVGVRVYYLDTEKVLSSGPISRERQTYSWVHALFTAMTSSLPLCCEITKLSLFMRRLDPRPDLVHCWLLYANLTGSIAARLAKVPLVVTSVRNIQSEVAYNYYDPRWQRPIERATVPLVNLVTANAPAVATDYLEFTRIAADKIVMIPNGVDLKTAHHLTQDARDRKRLGLGLNCDDMVVGTVARLAKEKDFETFLRAIGLAREQLPAICSVIIGEGPLRSHLESFASSLGLRDVVQFLGERKDVGELLQCCDVFLLSSIIEGMPNAVMESQLLGVPVVATRAGGTVNLIRAGETGLLAPIGDANALASCIVKLFTDNALRRRISLAAAQQIRERYTIEELVARTEGVYGALLDAGSDRVTVPCAE